MSNTQRPLRTVAQVLRKLDRAEWGGIETHVSELVTHLPTFGWAPRVYAPKRKVPSATEPFPDVVRYDALCPFIGPEDARSALIASSGNIVSIDLLTRLRNDRSIPLAHVHTGLRIAAGVRVAMRSTGRPYIVSVHGPLLAEPEMVSADTSRRLARVVDIGQPLGLLLGSRRVLADAARIICFNDDEHQALQARFGHRAVRMDHGVDRARLSSGIAERAQSRWAFLSGAPVVTVVGRLSRQKNQRFAVRAFAAGAPAYAQLVLAGAETDPGYASQVLAEAEALGIRDRVHWLGNLNARDEVPDLLAITDLLLVPSIHEAFGLAVLEGWAAKTPVLFADATGMADLARALNHSDATVKGFDERIWAENIRALLGNTKRRDDIARAGSALLAKRFSWEIVAQNLSALYGEVLAESASTRKHGWTSHESL